MALCLCITADRLDLQNKDRVNCNQKTACFPWWPSQEWSSVQKGGWAWGVDRTHDKTWLCPVTHKWEVRPRKRCPCFGWFPLSLQNKSGRAELDCSFILGVSKHSSRTPSSVFSLLPKHRVQYLNNNLKAISFPKDQILAIFCSLVSKEKRLSFQTSGITYLEKPPVLKPSN